MNVIELKDITKTFGKGEAKTEVLKNIDLLVREGEFLAIMGPSGSGKTTLMNIIGLLDSPSSGNYQIGNRNANRLKDKQLAKLRRQKIGFVFQTFNLLGRLNLQQNVELPMIYTGLKPAKRHKRAELLLKQVGLADRAKFRPNQISGGQVQRAAIARALANQPDLILADEPTGNLDTKSSHQVMQLLSKLNQRGATVLVITHNPEVAAFAHRTVHIRDGQIVERRV